MLEENQQHKSLVAQKEEEILSFWNTHHIFEKSLKKKSPKGSFVFYDGPPFATGLPHYGHLLASTIKDVIPRYKTMRGYNVRRQWGWDCHGLPIENLIEAEFGLERKKDIEKFGIGEFNRAAQNSVLRYDSEWKKIIPRIGRWVDMEHGYKTMDPEYTESIWWAFKTLYDKGLLYEGYKSMHICPRCETTLAVSEVGMGYKDITDISVTAKFELLDEPRTYLLVWTTTPWTLPGNVALAVRNDFDYVKIRIKSSDHGVEEYFILAKERLSIIKNEYEIIDEFKGSALVGKKYKPIFNYYADALILKNRENGWKVYPAPFVSKDEGTGIVHIAPAFGENDMELGKTYQLPFVQHVSFDGVFKKEVTDFAGLAVKPKHDPQATDIEIIIFLARYFLLFDKVKLTHAYPFCWRCDTPLLNYAASSWFVKVVALKEKFLHANKKINWIPASLRDGRFGKWLLGARDWAVSRSRFWGAPIPVWKCDACKRFIVLGSVADMQKGAQSSHNTYLVMRHGEAINNTESVVTSNIDEQYGLTEKGKKEVREMAALLSLRKIDFVVTSPLPRARQTASIVAEELHIPQDHVIVDDRLKEITMGEFEGTSVASYHAYFSSPEERFSKRPEGGENVLDVKKRVGVLLDEIENKYSHKTILFVSHETPIRQLFSVARGLSMLQETAAFRTRGTADFIANAEMRILPFHKLPRNVDYELDLHRPFIDSIKFPCRCGGEMNRVPEVFDCWFESGSMPFAQFHYPFENQELFKKNFPAHFIAEGLDQTRGWFYTMLILGIGLFGKSAYNNVVVNGLILAEDGQKISKKLKNYPDPVSVINMYGADALRYYLLSSPVVRGENLNFSEKDVQEVMNKIITRLRNVYAFYALYKDVVKIDGEILKKKSAHVLDVWIRVRLETLINDVTSAIENYELDKAIRPIGDFIEDLSLWYIRRSRDRFKGEGKDAADAIATTYYVLVELAKIMAPFTPFIAEEIYRNVTQENNEKSVHLSSWPSRGSDTVLWGNPVAFFARLFKSRDEERILSDMKHVRAVVSLALLARTKNGLKVRQPLAELRIKNKELRIKNNKGLINLIKDEVNVKNIVFGANIVDDVELDTRITPELKKEGMVREFIRYVQDLRKKADLLPSQKVDALIDTDEAGKHLVSSAEKELKKILSLKTISFEVALGEKIVIENVPFAVELKK
ncbi:MAG: class I tRNA ligase family protein [bacterium]|nr:class I tRNA ligase family protein [bacterium]